MRIIAGGRVGSPLGGVWEEKMREIEVRIVRLEPMRVAAARAISESPERDAWQTLCAWAEPRGLLNDVENNPVFGFNNPNPSPNRPTYGYEFWVRVDPDQEPEGEIVLKDFEGGRYAVTTCRLQGDPSGTLPEVWRKLWEWVEASNYRWRKTHELEKPRDPLVPPQDLVLDLLLPIEE
jgi:DNA gyrase inhibitor GyrI